MLKRDALYKLAEAGDRKRLKVDHDEEAKRVESKTTDGSSAAAAATTSQEPERNFVSFPARLMSILESGEASDSILWNDRGDTFCILPKEFSESVLQKHFHGTKFESFTRKLNRWGFKRVIDQSFPPRALVYRHELFQRGKEELLIKMKGGRKKEVNLREQLLREQISYELKQSAAATAANSALSFLPQAVAQQQHLQQQQQQQRNPLLEAAALRSLLSKEAPTISPPSSDLADLLFTSPRQTQTQPTMNGLFLDDQLLLHQLQQPQAAAATLLPPSFGGLSTTAGVAGLTSSGLLQTQILEAVAAKKRRQEQLLALYILRQRGVVGGAFR